MDLLRSHGWTVFRRNTGAFRGEHHGKRRFVRFSEPGAADLWCLTPPPRVRHVEVELKRPGRKPTPEQVRWLLELNARGAPAFWVDNLTVLDVVARHLMQGGTILYDGPSGDYDLTWENPSCF